MALVRADGTAADLAVEAPTTLRALLEDADVHAFEFDYLDVEGATTARLTRAQAFDDVAVALADDGELRVGDVDGVRTLRLGKGSALRVVGSADDTRVDAGDRVRFAATVSGLQDGEVARIRWTFGDGARGRGVRADHRFARAGRYAVVVGATTKADRAGASDVLVVQVGKAAVAPTATPTPSPVPAAAAGTAPPTAPAAASGAGSGPAPRAAPKPKATPTPAPTAAPRGTRVAGELLGAAVPAAAVTRPPADPPDDDGALHVPPGVVGTGVALLLAAAGFRLDMRRARPGWR